MKAVILAGGLGSRTSEERSAASRSSGTSMKIHSANRVKTAWPHTGFRQPMDTLREKNLLEELWSSGRAPWKTW